MEKLYTNTTIAKDLTYWNKQPKGTFSLFQANIRRLSKNRGTLLAFLSTMDNKFDIIVLTEIGNDGDDYINKNILSEYDAFIDLLKNNRYGGVAILVKRGYGDIIQREELYTTKTCDCDRCQTENIWVEIKSGNANYVLSAIYRHPNGNALYKYAHTYNRQFSHTHRPYICEIQHPTSQLAICWLIYLTTYPASLSGAITHSLAKSHDHLYVYIQNKMKITLNKLWREPNGTSS